MTNALRLTLRTYLFNCKHGRLKIQHQEPSYKFEVLSKLVQIFLHIYDHMTLEISEVLLVVNIQYTSETSVDAKMGQLCSHICESRVSQRKLAIALPVHGWPSREDCTGLGTGHCHCAIVHMHVPHICMRGAYRKEGSVPCPGQPELAYKGENFSSRDRFRPCI